MCDQRALQQLNFQIAKFAFARWKSATTAASMYKYKGCVTVVYIVAVLDIIIILGHIIYPFILVYLIVNDILFAKIHTSSSSKMEIEIARPA